MPTMACAINITSKHNSGLHWNFVFMILLAGVEAPNEEVHLPLETHSEVDGGRGNNQ